MVGVVAPWWAAGAIGGVIAMLAVGGRLRRGIGVLGVLIIAGAVSGSMAEARRDVPVDSEPRGIVTVRAIVTHDPIASWSHLAVVTPVSIGGRPWGGPSLAAAPLPGVEVGDVVDIRASLSAGARRIRARTVSGTLRVDEMVSVRASSNPLVRIGNGLRARVRSTFGGSSPKSALVTGLLIGDTADIPVATLEDLRRAGLAHFVAVSGSNVALFLGVWWLLGAPLAIRPRVRVAYGLVGLVIFAVATRFEPSVIRASVMAAVPLVGGLMSVPVDPWMALGTAIAVVVLVSAELATSVGFLLSVLATAGVLVGVGAVNRRRPRWFWIPLGATVGAQVGVAPLLLAVFGTIPLAAPVTNLIAGPVVAVTTTVALGAVIIPIPIVADAAELGAALVIAIAERGSIGPQLDVVGVLGASVAIMLALLPRLRPLALAAAAVGILWIGASGPSWPDVPTAVVLDVGQGDAILVQDPSGSTMLVDGGRDPAALDAALRRHGVRSVDLVVVTHGDADHVGGLIDLVAAGDVGTLWRSPFGAVDGLVAEILTVASATRTPIVEVAAGARFQLGSIGVEILAPARRFASDNDGSIVMMLSADRSMLLPGDIEAVAQRELPAVDPDVLVVPHHGSATSDLDWLRATVPEVAILSYGENRYGHPHPDVLAVLDGSGSIVRHTLLHGDVVVPLAAP